MKDYELIITINSPGVVEKLDYVSKANSVLFVNYSKIVEKIFQEFETDKDFNRFRYNLCVACRDFTKIKQYSNGYRIESPNIEITQNLLANCLPRRIRVKYFYYDKFYERFILKNNLNRHYL